MTSMLSQVGPGEHRRQRSAAIPQRLHRILARGRRAGRCRSRTARRRGSTTSGPRAARAPSRRPRRWPPGRQINRPGSAMMRTRFGSLAERRADRRAEAADVGDRLRVVDREAAADVERVARRRASPCAPAASSLAQASIASTCLPGIRRLRAHVERQAAHVDRRAPRASRASPTASSGSQPNLRDRSHTAPGLRNDTRSSSSARSRSGANLRTSSGLSATNIAHAEFAARCGCPVALDRVRVDAALRVDAQPRAPAAPRRWSPDRGTRPRSTHGLRPRPDAAAASARSAGRRPAAPCAACGTARARARSPR